MSLTGDVLGQIGAEVSLNGGVGGSIQFTGEGTDNYDELDNRPSINGVVLTGNKTTEDLHIPTGGTDDYLDLNNKPKINGVTLRGDVSSASLQIPYDDLINRPVIPDLTDLENRMDAVEGDIQSIETDIGDIGDRLIDIASDIATIQATDIVQNSDISSLKNRMNAAETTITSLGSRLTTAEGTITNLSGRLDTAEGNISNAQNDISDLQGDVTSLDTIVGNGQQTVGSDLTDAVTQLNSSLNSKITLKEFHSANVTLYTDTDYTDYHYIFTQTYTSTPRVVLDLFTATTTRNNIPIAVIQALSLTSVIVRVWKQVGVANTSTHTAMATPQLNIAVFGN